MPTELLGAAGMTPELKTFYSKALLARLVPALEHANHGLAEDIPPHAGKVIEKRRFESYAPQTTQLSEGTVNLGSAINGTWTAIPFTVSQYGAFALVSDLLAQQGFDGLDDMVNAFGENAGNSIKNWSVEYKFPLIDMNPETGTWRKPELRLLAA